MAHDEIPLERRTLHGHFSPELEPILTVDSGDSIAFSCLNSGWRTAEHELFLERDDVLDEGHALIGPVVHPTAPPRPCGGNIDCKELVPGTTLFLPISVDGALLSAGDGHAAQGDGEVSQLAIEAPVERAQLMLAVRDDLALRYPMAWTPDAWLTFGFHEDLDEAAAIAIEGMLELMGREHGLEQREASLSRASSSICG